MGEPLKTDRMDPRFQTIIRDLHLYMGLCAAPFVLVFSLSVFPFVHGWVPGVKGTAGETRTAAGLTLPGKLESLEGRERIDALRGVLAGAGVDGEISFVRHDPKQGRLVIPVVQPGREITVELDLGARTATITRCDTGVWDALASLHKSPGPHLANIRMNWFPMRVWLWLADGAVYLVLFLSASGIYLWALLRRERRAGLIIMGAGALTFIGMVYALAG